MKSRDMARGLVTVVFVIGVAGIPLTLWGEQKPDTSKSGTAGNGTVETAQAEQNKKTVKPQVKATYRPPSVGAPGGRIGGGTRGENQTFLLSVLAPDHTGLTSQTQPAFYWFLNKPITTGIVFTLRDNEQIKPLVEAELRPPFQAGIHQVKLGDFNVELQPGKAYRWYVSLVVDPERRSKDVLAGGFIERVDLPADAASTLARTESSDRGRVYAEAGYWYDAIATLSEQINTAPPDSTLRVQRALLLQQVGLSEIAAYDLNPLTIGVQERG